MAILTRVIAVFVIIFCCSIAAFAEKRIALVIGNSAYALAPLQNPRNDADDLTAVLKRLEFDVTERKDLTIREFDNALEDFVQRSKDADIAIFFFSGHGVQIDKRGYLAPVDIKAKTESSALRELEPIQDTVSRIENAAKVSVIIIDACRDSQLQERLRRIALERNKAVSPAKGLPPPSVIGSNTLVVYATAPGEIASDGQGRNSPFTAALLRNIETPGLEVELMFKRVTGDVLKQTAGKQQPERLSRLQSELILMASQESALWDSVKDSTKPEIIGTYLTKYPSGIYAPQARALIKQIEQQKLLEEALEEERKRRSEAEKKEAGVRKLEEELIAQRAALGEEKRRIEDARTKQETEKQRQESEKATTATRTDEQRKLDEAKLAEAKKRAEELKQSEELRQAKEEARLAHEAAEAAEKKRQIAEKAAEEARAKLQTLPLTLSKGSQKPQDGADKASLGVGRIQGRGPGCYALSCSEAKNGCLRKGHDPSKCSSHYAECLRTGAFNGRVCQLRGLARQ
ncbi:MAG: caspase family protein [Rhodomicrobium sp.]